MVRRILHLDMDAFYASVEALDRPELKGRAVIVGGRQARSVVCACSYEARRFGVRSAMPMRRARELCPRAVYLPPRMERYAEVSHSIFEILLAQTPLVEKMSIDEGYLDLTDLAGIEGAESDRCILDLARGLKQEIRIRTGLACSIGIAPCKFASKIASDLRKPDALVLVPVEGLQRFLDPLDVARIPGVGEVGRRRLRALSVQIIESLRRQPRDALISLFGKWGGRLHDFAHGIDPRPVVTRHERKSVGREHTYEEDVLDTAVLLQTLGDQSEVVASHLEDRGLRVRTVTVKVRYDDFEQVTRQMSFERAVSSRGEIARVAEELLGRTDAGQRPVRLVGVSVSGFVPVEEDFHQQELPLFGERPAPARKSN